MRHKDPELMQRICDFVDDCFFSENHMPSTAEIGEYYIDLEEKENRRNR